MTGPHAVAHGTTFQPPPRAGGWPRPEWVDRIPREAAEVAPQWYSRFLPPDDGVRQSAVLALFGPGRRGEESLLLIERAHTLRKHPAQIAFPGGGIDPDDGGAVGAALREAGEEIRLDPGGVEIVGQLPALWVPVSGYAVTTVVGWWRAPSPVAVGEPQEVAQVLSVPVDFLTDPANRYTALYPSGHSGPAWDLDEHDLLLWGFTAGVVDKLLELAGRTRPWDREVRRPVPERYWQGR